MRLSETVKHLFKKGGLKAIWTWGEAGPNATSRYHRWRAAHNWAHHRAKQGGPDKAKFVQAAHVYHREAKKNKPDPLKTYPMGGWAPPGPANMQRIDQGQDFEIPLGAYVQAPGSGEVILHNTDRPFPYGFGYHAVVRIDTGPFSLGSSATWYVGHANANLAPVGTKLEFGTKISQTDHFLNAGWGWVELGHYPYGPMGTGNQYHDLFVPVKHK